MFDFNLICLLLAYMIPLYVANASPLLIHGDLPLDLSITIKNKRLLGKGKTILGTLIGISFGAIAGFIFAFFYPDIFLIIPNYLLLVVFLSTGAILGDIVESFFKRRLGFESGAQLILFDQIDFVIGGLVLSFFVFFPKLEVIIILFFGTIILHLATNILAYKIGLKKVPW